MKLTKNELRAIIEAIEYVPGIDIRLTKELKPIRSKLIEELRKSYGNPSSQAGE